ncbi:hypothetical protein AVEN_143455-1 [Araneus ventricosus]|uniref:Uncharacterized protein n=1 Tax=Araneus ventricosus TaxID=182803 RepID=A0A4Y2HCK1_ARAVE|nr:hypothetical protein AVEN_143455-1 [Araneus ventricosus]
MLNMNMTPAQSGPAPFHAGTKTHTDIINEYPIKPISHRLDRVPSIIFCKDPQFLIVIIFSIPSLSSVKLSISIRIPPFRAFSCRHPRPPRRIPNVINFS